MGIFGRKASVNPLGKMAIFVLFQPLFFIAQNGVFFVLEDRKSRFSGLFSLKKKLGEMVIFGPKPWVNPFVKMSVFRLLELLVFIAQKKLFFVPEYRKRHFPALYCLKKKKSCKNGHFAPKPWVNPLGDMSIFRLCELLVFIAQKAVFLFQNIVNDISLAYIS